MDHQIPLYSRISAGASAKVRILGHRPVLYPQCGEDKRWDNDNTVCRAKFDTRRGILKNAKFKLWKPRCLD
jgi:hypothetical protein